VTRTETDAVNPGSGEGDGDGDGSACHFGRLTGEATVLLTGGADGRSTATNSGPVAVIGPGSWGFHLLVMTGLTHNLPGKYD
jgi:hypothetical protein